MYDQDKAAHWPASFILIIRTTHSLRKAGCFSLLDSKVLRITVSF
jgi:hypothetical protein